MACVQPHMWHCVGHCVAASHGRHHARPRNPSGKLMGTGRSTAIPIPGESVRPKLLKLMSAGPRRPCCRNPLPEWPAGPFILFHSPSFGNLHIYSPHTQNSLGPSMPLAAPGIVTIIFRTVNDVEMMRPYWCLRFLCSPQNIGTFG